MNKTVFIVEGDVIGWTFEGNQGPISFRYDPTHKTHYAIFKKVNGVDVLPVLGENVKFESIILPAKYSIAVQVDPSK